MVYSRTRFFFALALGAGVTGCVTTGERAIVHDDSQINGQSLWTNQDPDVNTRDQPTPESKDVPGADSDSVAFCSPRCRVHVKNAHPHEALAEHAERLGITIQVQGKLLDPVSVAVDEPTVDRLVRRLADHGGYLVAQNGRHYTLYGAEVAEVTIAHPLRHIEASDAAAELARFDNHLGMHILKSANALVLRGGSEAVRRATDFLDIIDYERPNVYLELMVVEYFHGDDFAWSFDVMNAQKGNVSGLTLSPGAGLVSGMYDVIADLDKAFKLNLVALVEDSDARVVTNPHVAVRSGLPGEINFKEELHVILTNSTENFGLTRSLEKLEAGVRLNVTPQVLSSGFVNLKVQGEVGVFVPAPEGQFAIDRQTVQTEVLVEEGKTLIIGGLVKKQVSSTNSGVPGLRRIPLVGKLFKSETSSEQFVETVIYITPHVSEPGAFSPASMRRDVETQFNIQ